MVGLTVLDGNRFYVAGPAGDAGPGEAGLAGGAGPGEAGLAGEAGPGEQGFYADDVRVLSRWRLTLNGRPIAPVGSTPDAAPVVTVHGQVPAPDRPGAPPVTVRRRLSVSRAGLAETLTLTNHATGPARVLVRYGFAADFLDLIEVKEQSGMVPSAPRRGLPPLSTARRWLGDGPGWLLSAAVPGFAAAVQICFDADPGAVPGYADGATYFEVSLPAGAGWTVRAAVLLLGDRAEPSPDPAAVLAAAEARTAARQRDWAAAAPRLATNWPGLAGAYRRAVADLGALRTPAPGSELDGSELDGELLPAAGLPWFMTIFGRDTLITCLQTLPLGPRPARAALRALAALQSTVDDPARDAEPGKIVHEVRSGPITRLTGTMPYYGSVDATPLFLLLAAQTWRWTGDAALLRELEPALRAALSWMDGPADLTGRGYLEFHRRSAAGLEVQSWKDSFNAMLFADGRRAESPIAGCEVQGYAYAARLGLAEIARAVWADPALATRLESDAAALKARFHRDFWVDTPAGGHYALALDRDGARVDSLTSNIGHLLWTGIAAESTVDRTVAALLGPELFTGWGIRTMSSADAGYHPVEYHDGTVWPHDTSLVCLGLARAGRYAEAGTLLRGLIDAAEHLDGRLPEVLAGFDRADTGIPLVYPTTCVPQAWAAAAPIAALTATLGLTPDPGTGTLAATGAPPADLDLTLTGVAAHGRLWTVTAAGGKATVTPA
ncbi:MAG TPA: glycogen debranching N-terminal domain-containing protein [Mycobacteriales bacterium]|nr:glycogen debranching N-terminal domain-containing protein [Mycobacteriales bacterium]